MFTPVVLSSLSTDVNRLLPPRHLLPWAIWALSSGKCSPDSPPRGMRPTCQTSLAKLPWSQARLIAVDFDL
jgi:hypothetical protein